MHKSMLIGWVSRDPEFDFDDRRQEPFLKFGLGLNQGKDKPPKFVTVQAYGDLAERFGEILHKGYNVVVGGNESFSAYLKNGEAVPSITIFADYITTLPSFKRRDS